MPLFLLNEQTQETAEKRTVILNPKRFDYFVAVNEGDTGPGVVTRGGKRVRAVAVDDVKALLVSGTVYQIARGKSTRIQNVDLTGAHKQSFQTYVFAPELAKLKDDSLDSRWELFEAALKQAQTQKANIFLGPEYFFTKNSTGLGGTSSNHVYTEAEKDDVEKRLKTVAGANKGMLIIPGTMLWKNAAGSVQNTALICGADGAEITSHSKVNAHNDEAFAANAQGTWKPGDQVHRDFEFRGVRCRYHICADDSRDVDEENVKELHLVSGYDYGAFNPRAHVGGFEIKSDGASGGAKVQKGGIETNSNRSALAVTMAGPDSAQGSSALLEVQRPGGAGN